MVLFQHEKGTKRKRKRTIPLNPIWERFDEMEEPDEPRDDHAKDLGRPDKVLDQISDVRRELREFLAEPLEDNKEERQNWDEEERRRRDKQKRQKRNQEATRLRQEIGRLKQTLIEQLEQKHHIKEEQLKTLLQPAWKDAEKRFLDEEIGTPLLKLGNTHSHPRVRAALYRFAMLGAKHKKGNWAWLHYPPESVAYDTPRTHWLTRMPEKDFEQHGEPALLHATLQPVDSIFNSMRARVRAVHRPALRADGRSFAESYVLPSVVHSEILIYLAGRNYSKRRKRVKKQSFVPAFAMGLARSAEDEGKLDYLKAAWDFQLGIEHAETMAAWLRR